MQKKNNTLDADKYIEEKSDIFRTAIKDVKPMKSEKSFAPLQKSGELIPDFTLKLRRKHATEKHTKEEGLSDHEVEMVEPEAYISFKHPSVSHAVFKALKNGRYDIAYNLDLHGYTIEEARKIIVEFVAFSRNKHFKCVRIIHGKSYKNYHNQKATLKGFVYNWLKQLSGVLAFSSCLPKNGARGAVYVLLRKNNKPGERW